MRAPRCRPAVLAVVLGLGTVLHATDQVQAANINRPAFVQRGKASFYGPGFHGKRTASGERFNQHELTAAHPDLPLGAQVTVTNLENGKTVQVQVNDRGPYKRGRVIDLSKAAAAKIGITKKNGIAPVKVEATADQLAEAKASADREVQVASDE